MARDQVIFERTVQEAIRRASLLFAPRRGNQSSSGNASSTQAGLVPPVPADATKYLSGSAPPVFQRVIDSDLLLSDVTSNNVSVAKHGFAPKAPGSASKYLDGTGAWSTPPGSGVARAAFPTITGLELRLSARDSVLGMTNGLVTSISDISGNGRNSSAISGAQRPRYYPAAFNGWLPCLFFNGLASGSSTVVSVPTGITLNDPMSIVIVMQNYLNGTPSQFLYRGNNGGAVGLNNGGSAWSIFNGTIVSSNPLFNQNTAAPFQSGATTHPCVRMDIYNRAASIISNNGVEVAVGDPGNTAGGIASPWVIGSEGAPGGIGGQAGRFLLYEMLFFSKALSIAERAALNTFYQQDTGLPFV